MTAVGISGKAITAMIFAVLAYAAPSTSHADPSKYPRFAQQSLPKDIKPEFISVDELAREIKNGAEPMIIDVRTAEEFREAHIKMAVSAPLAQFGDYIPSVPRDRLTVLY
ncbi:MAG: rhodanese-like domain-containing protein [Deltaproteobacteria bacterium]|nr:rhodanese-like domain-containing protein [Deltaproteobacteria bacterium]